MFPSPACPRAGQSGLWQDWACGSIGASPGARSGDHARRDARWTRAFQVVTPPAPRFPGVLPVRTPDGRTYLCGVGMTEFTPPEMQAVDLASEPREENH